MLIINALSSRFPLIQLPRKSEGKKLVDGLPQAVVMVSINSTSEEVRRKLPHGILWVDLPEVSINSTSEEVRRSWFSPLAVLWLLFPLIQLPRKSEA